VIENSRKNYYDGSELKNTPADVYINDLESENEALKARNSLCPDCPNFLPDGPAVPVEEGAIKELIDTVSESNTDENNIKMVAIDKEFIDQARAELASLQQRKTNGIRIGQLENENEALKKELASLRRPVDRDALATLLKKFGHGSWRSSAEWITIDTPIETILDAIIKLIGRDG